MLKKYDNAVETLTSAIKENMNASVVSELKQQRGLAYFQLKKYDEALLDF